jgi:hypothetical protein
MRSAAFLLACFRRVAASVVVNIALKGVDAACLTENAQLSRCDCPASCSCLQPAVRLHRGRLLLRVPRSAHVMLVNMGSASTGNIVLILSHLPVREPPYFLTNARWRQSHPLIFQVDSLSLGANATAQFYGLTLYDANVHFQDLPCRSGCGFSRCELR